eukprot:g2586.t1
MKWSGAGAPCLVLLTVSLVEVSHSIAIQSYAEQLKEAQAAEVQSDRFYAEEADERHLAELAAPQVSVSTALAMLRGVLADGKARVAKLNKQEEESKELFQKQETLGSDPPSPANISGCFADSTCDHAKGQQHVEESRKSALRQWRGGSAGSGRPFSDLHDRPLGLQELSADNQALVFLGNLFLDRSVEAIFHVLAHGGDFSLENPELSLMWNTPQVARLLHWARAYTVDFDQCIFGAPSVKPTRLLVSHQAFQLLCGRCDGGHSHERLTGQIWSDHFQKLVYRTKLAQVYPAALCSSMATIVHNVWASDASQFSSSFTLVAGKRKRPVGQALRWKMHRQQLTAIKAVAAGYQLKRGALKPLLDVETEPGTAIAWALSISHPLTAELVMDPQLQCAVDALTMDPAAVVTRRLEELQHWEARAQQLLPQTDQILSRLPDPALRRLLRGTTDDQPVQLGACCHILLYYEMLDAANSVDKFLPDLLLHGFPIALALL